MKPDRRQPVLFWIAISALLLVAIPALTAVLSCSRAPSSKPLSNRAPAVRIVRGQIVENDTLTQVSEIDWIGWDDDGVIDHYLYALDVPDSLDSARIADPATPGINWVPTTETSGRFTFTTAIPETALGSDGTMSVTNRYLGHHRFHIRSVDNEGALSKPDQIRFTVTNVMPRTTITTPKVTQFAAVGSQIYIAWSGRDPDKPTADQQPVAYEYKLIPIATIFANSDPQWTVDVMPGPQYPWTRVPADTRSARLQLEPGNAYWFVIRAIDYLGAVENRFTSGINAFKIQSSLRNYDRPMLTVKEPRFGKHVFPDDGLTADVTIYTDQCLNFEFTADLSLYGGILLGYNVGVDVPDIEDTSPESGFLGWTTIAKTIRPICFRYPGSHHVYILCRDTGGGLTVGRYDVTVKAVPVRDRDVLFVDDYGARYVGGLSDAAMDARGLALVEAAGFSPGSIYKLDPWGPNDSYGLVSVPTREDLGRYRLIIWQVEGAGTIGNGRNGLINSLECSVDRWLLKHVQSGGALWIYGDHAVGGVKTEKVSYNGCTGSVGSATTGQDMLPTDFLCLNMGICGGSFHQVRTDDSKNNGLVAALPTYAAEEDLMPRLEADSTTYSYTLLGGLRYIDAAFGPIPATDRMEPLYTMKAVKANSPFNNRQVAWRWADDDPVPAHGAIAFFTFSMHEVKQGSAEERTGALGVARSMGDWFRRYMPPPLNR